MLGTNLRCLDNLNGIWGFDTSNSLQTTSLSCWGDSQHLADTILEFLVAAIAFEMSQVAGFLG